MGRTQRAGTAPHRGPAAPAGGRAALEQVARGLRLHRGNDLAGAEQAYRAALRGDPDLAAAHHLLGLCLRRLGRAAEALPALRRAAGLAPGDAAIRSDLGRALLDAGDRAGAEDAFRQAVALPGDHAAAWSGLAALGAPREAVAPLRRLLAARPADPEGYRALGGALVLTGDGAEARRVYEAGLAAGALGEEGLRDHALEAIDEGRREEGLLILGLLADRRPKDPAPLNLIGCVLFDLRRLPEAFRAFQRALEVDPDDYLAHLNLGAIFTDLRAVNDALRHFRRAARLRPDALLPLYGVLDQRRHACDWDGMAADEARLLGRLAGSADRVPPFRLLVSGASPALIRDTARAWATGLWPRPPRVLPPAPPPEPGARIRVGYLSNDFFNHATAMLAVGLFERHDRARFEVFAYSHSPDDGSALRRRTVAAFEHFVELGDASAPEAARRIRQDRIDILVDLKGYTLGAWSRVLALRPAPVQVNYLGYPGTMGAPFIDYILGDPQVTPFAHQPDYDERIVQLPDCYQPNDADRAVAAPPGRAACGLPDDAFVFCCFNNTYKITPALFAAWMRILARVPDAVLWLYEANAAAQDNLQYAAGAQGIDPERLVFAPNQEASRHLARLRHADLVLDTLPYNAHTTASDALWAGVPVLTCLGETMAGRVAGSLLRAVGLPELVTDTLAAYEALACALAEDRDRLGALRARLAANRARAPLFDTARYARGIEAAYARMHALRCAGAPPEAFAVAPEPLPAGFDPGPDPGRP